MIKKVIEIVCCLSDMFKSLLKMLTDYDQHVVSHSAQLLATIKTNVQFIDLLTKYDQKHNQLFQTEMKSDYVEAMKTKLKLNEKLVNIGLNISSTSEPSGQDEPIEDDENYLKKFLTVLSARELEQKSTDFNESDLYKNNPVAVLDDIISSYQFEMDSEKTLVDCY
jgi:hypothetical protein